MCRSNRVVWNMAVYCTTAGMRLSRPSICAQMPRIANTSRAIAVRPGDGGRIRSGVVLRPHREDRPHAVDEAVGDGGGDDFATQTMALQARGEALPHGSGKISIQFGGEITIFRYVGMDQRPVQPNLAIARRMASSGRVSPSPALRRSAISSSDGRNSRARFRSPERSSARMTNAFSLKRSLAWNSLLLIA